MKELTREQWLEQASEFIMADRVYGIGWEVRENLKYKVTIGYAPNTKTGSKRIGACAASHVSEEGYNEIFISPEINDSQLVLATLLHELIHAIDDCQSGHGAPFRAMMRAFGLEGKPTATTATEECQRYFAGIIAILGAIPHAKMDFNSLPRQKSRNIKVSCSFCGFQFYASRGQLQFALNMNPNQQISCCACSQPMQAAQL
jgi:hypothetical protein